MMQYRYRAVDASGKVTQGLLEAANPDDLESRLARQGLALIRARANKPTLALWQKRAISRRDLIGFCFHLEQLIHAGLPLIEGLTDLRDSAENPRLREIVAGLITDVEGGHSLSQAMAAYPATFDSVFIHLIRTGEASGTLPEVFKQLAETLKWQDELAAQTRKIVLYPAFVGLLVGGVIIFLMIFLVPRLVAFVSDMGQTLPLSTRILIMLSDLLVQHGWLMALAVVSMTMLLRGYLWRQPVWRIRIDGWKLQLPVLGPILRKIILARFAHFFAMMFAAGIPVLDCLKISVGIVGNARVAEALTWLSIRIAEGSSIAAGFQESRLFPPLVLRMLHVGETTGALDTALRSVAYFYGRDVRESIAQIQSLIEPVLIVTLGLILAWIMSSVLGPIFDTIGTMR